MIAAGDGLNAREGQTFVLIDPDPSDRLVYAIDPIARTVRYGNRGIAGLLFNGASSHAKTMAHRHIDPAPPEPPSPPLSDPGRQRPVQRTGPT